MIDITRRTALKVLGATSLSLIAARGASADEVIKVGIIQPQQGNCALWGLPLTRAFSIWGDEVNEAGGIKAGDGKRYQIQVRAYDNVCYAAGDELKAARRAILDDGLHFLMQTYTPSCRQAIAELTNETKTLVTSYGGGYLSPKYPFLVGGQTGLPVGYMLVVSHVLQKHPDAKRVAILTIDTSFGNAARAYARAGVAAHPDAQIVYQASYSATATNDMLGLLSPVMDAKPDVIVELGMLPGQKPTLISTLDQLGFTGVYCSETWETSFLKQAGILETAGGRLFSAPSLDGREPTYSERAHKFYQRFIAKHGEAEWSAWASATQAAAILLEVAWQASPTMDAETVLKTLYGMAEVNHPIFGKSKWGGQDIFGCNHHLYTPQPIYGVSKAGEPTLEGIIQTADWWATNKAPALVALKSEGQVFAG